MILADTLKAETLIEQENGLTEEETRILKERGYEILHKLGEGQTREAYLARYSAGEVSKLRVLKIPKTEIDPDSICTLINKSKRDGDIAEVNVSNEIQHPNIVEVVDNFRLDGKTVNAEAYYEGTDLEAHIQTTGPLKDKKRVIKIFGQVVRALQYLNDEQFILHRDIKPSNIIITRSGNVKISDLQNAARRTEIHENIMPTRGGTPYTHPSLLNALVSGHPSKATCRTEVYALGGTFLYSLTGKTPLQYKICSDIAGKSIRINGKLYRVQLNEGEKFLEEITEEIHEKNLKKALNKVPKEWKKLIYRCLTINPKKEIRNMYDVKRYIEKINSGLAGKLKEAFAKFLKYSVPICTGAVLAGAVTGGIITARNSETRPRLRDILMREDYRNFSLDNLDSSNKDLAFEILVPYMEKAKENLPEVKFGKRELDIKELTRFSRDIHLMPKRLISSWLRACYLNKELIKTYKADKEERLFPSFVPKYFLLRNENSDSDIAHNTAKVVHGVTYLKQCFVPQGTIADVFTNYFSSLEEINTAKVKTGSINYFPKWKIVERAGGYKESGYGSYLPYHQQKLINTALALYMITDEEGNVDFNKIPKKNNWGTGWEVQGNENLDKSPNQRRGSKVEVSDSSKDMMSLYPAH